jgi:hypothetical protein
MPTRRPKETLPDLFSTPVKVSTPAPQAVPEGKGAPANQLLSPRHFLPKDLAGSLRRLDDAELDALLAAVTEEAKRRNRLPSGATREKVRADGTPPARRVPTEDGVYSLRKGQLNAVRAAFKAGVKPSAIARQFRISHSVVRKALASERSDRKRER